MTRPYNYQREAAAQIERFGGRALLAHEMGLGKSLVALLWIKRNPDIRPIVVVCPAVVKWHWVREASMHIGMRAEVLSGTKPQPFGLVQPQIVVINYDILKYWLPVLRGMRPQLVIIDECHACGNFKTQRTKSTRRLCQGVPHVICMSGTPLTNRPAELFPGLNILRPDLFPSFIPFAEKFCRMRRTPWDIDYRGAKHLGELHQLLTKEVMIRRLKREVLTELPAMQHIVVPVEIEDRADYDDALKDFVLWMSKNYNRVEFNHALRAQWFAYMGRLKMLAGEKKLPANIAWIDDFLENSDEKLIVFGIHRAVLRPLHAHYTGSALIDGAVTGRDRQAVIDKFTNDSKCRLLFGNIQAAGLGWNGTAKGRCTTVAFVELPWKPAEITQAKDRIHRIGMGTKASCYFLIARGTIESRLIDIILKKQSVCEETLNGKVSGELDIMRDISRI